MAEWGMFRGRVGTAVLASCATAALIAGTATAASLITGADVKNGSLTGLDVRNGSLTGADVRNGSIGSADLAPAVRAQLTRPGAAGPTGPAGPQGAQGQQGVAGADGADAGSMVSGRVDDVPVTTAPTSRFAYVGMAGTTDPAFPARATLIPNRAMVAGDFIARIQTVGLGSVTFDLFVNGSQVAFGCTVFAFGSSCVSPTPTVEIPAGAVISMRILTQDGTLETSDVMWAFRLSTAPAG